jgi:hypothetical protein
MQQVLGHVARIREWINVYRILVKKSKETDNLEDLGSHGVDNIKMSFKEIGWEGAQWIHQLQDRG